LLVEVAVHLVVDDAHASRRRFGLRRLEHRARG
jgi:hypothetical protein